MELIPNTRMPDGQLSLERVNVFMGANGTGKSRLLQELKAWVINNQQGRSIIYVEGGRKITLVNSLSLDSRTFGNYYTLDSAQNTYRQKRPNTVTDRVKDALLVLERQEEDLRSRHSDDADAWAKSGQKGPYPERPEPPINRLFRLFEEIFPTISLSYDRKTKNLRCSKQGQSEYGPSSLSDGEKQVFSLIADLLILGENESFIVVDEPELNLNSGLANQLWDLIENESPDSTFVYGTHSVSFAMRRNVSKLFVLSNIDANILEIEDIAELPRSELQLLLGSIPGILSCRNAIVVEGEESSFDFMIISWLLKGEDTNVVAVGSCEEVRAVATRTGVYERIAAGVSICGIIDRDFRDDAQIANIASDNCVVLPYHESESLLCHPGVVHHVADAIGSQEPIPSIEHLQDTIVSHCDGELLQIAARRAFAKARIKLNVSLHRSVLARVTNIDELKKLAGDAATKESQKAKDVVGPEVVRDFIDEEAAKIRQAVDERDIDQLLKLAPGKQLLNLLAPIAGCANAISFARCAKRHLNVEDFDHLTNLRDTLLAKLKAPSV